MKHNIITKLRNDKPKRPVYLDYSHEHLFYTKYNSTIPSSAIGSWIQVGRYERMSRPLNVRLNWLNRTLWDKVT